MIIPRHCSVVGTVLGIDTTVCRSTDPGPKDLTGKEKRMLRDHRGRAFTLAMDYQDEDEKEENFKQKKKYVQRSRGKGMLGKAGNLEKLIEASSVDCEVLIG